ncbi:hypothetical protein JCM30237_07570 [Halolamina litorea]|uniref:TasA family protein n=1 Tax=Halolamina litorea TaxID=1515593 RepID=A0ABD6BRJ4_9EURY|nr:TasA family protein [Halolamina litorea]
MSDDDSWSAEITRRRALGGMFTLGAAASAAGAGTMALFSDTESSTGNTVQAGTLDLTVNGSGSNAVVDVSNVAPGNTGSDSTRIRNDGTLPGYLTFGVAGFANPENGVNEPESGALLERDPRGASSGGDHTGELAQSLDIKMKLLVDGDPHYLVGDENEYELASEVRLGAYSLNGDSGPADLQLDAGQEIEFVTDYKISDNVRNEVQSDSVVIDLAFALMQERGQTVVPETREVDASTIGPKGNNAGVRFAVTNDFGQEATVSALHVQPANTDLELLSDLQGGSGYRNGNYDFGADVYVDADTDGWVDGGSGEFPVPGWIDLTADGYDDNADREAVIAAGNTATVSLYAFRQTEGSYPFDMTDEPVRVTLDVTLNDGTETFVPLTMTPE